MNEALIKRGGGFKPPPFDFVLVPSVKPEQLRENMLSSMSRGLPEISLKNAPCKPHEHELSIAAGGPSLDDTWKDLKGYVGAVNGSLSFLLKKGVIPNACGVCHAEPHMADIIEPHPDVTYYVASIVHPSVFEKLKGCNVVLWHCSSVPGAHKTLNELRGKTWMEVGGGSTMGLRWMTLGYTCGFRTFHLHGMDSSFRVGGEGEKRSHAYADHQDAYDWLEFYGYKTRPNFIAQVMDFLTWLERFKDDDADPIKLTVHGDGFLQAKYHEWKQFNPGWHDGGPKPYRAPLEEGFIWPANDRQAKPAILNDVKYMDQFLAYVPARGTVVQAGGNVGVYPAHLARRFNFVHTFEPDAANYVCLEKNIQGIGGSIRAYHAALGERDGNCSVAMHDPENVGTVRVSGPAGNVEMRRIDGLGLPACDLIWLDAEGYERRILEGAEATVEKFWPAVIIEENGPAAQSHGIDPGAAAEWLFERGYIATVKLGNDRLYLPSC